MDVILKIINGLVAVIWVYYGYLAWIHPVEFYKEMEKSAPEFKKAWVLSWVNLWLFRILTLVILIVAIYDLITFISG